MADRGNQDAQVPWKPQLNTPSRRTGGVNAAPATTATIPGQTPAANATVDNREHDVEAALLPGSEYLSTTSSLHNVIGTGPGADDDHSHHPTQTVPDRKLESKGKPIMDRVLDSLQYFVLWVYSGNSVDRRILSTNDSQDEELNKMYLLRRKGSLFRSVVRFKGSSQAKALEALQKDFERYGGSEYLERQASQADAIRFRHPSNWWSPKVNDSNIFLQRGLFADSTPFHVAVLFNNVGMAKALHLFCPWYIDIDYTEDVYLGEHSLHIAVVNCVKSAYWSKTVAQLRSESSRADQLSRTNDMLTFLVESKTDDGERKKMLNVKVKGFFFDRKSELHMVNWGETPLTFAATLFLPRVIMYLVDQGADIFAVDDDGNNILHVLAMQVSKPKQSDDPENDAADPVEDDAWCAKLVDMCAFILELACGSKHGDKEFSCLEEQMNHKGMKPVHTAAYYGNVALFHYLMRKPPRERVYWAYGTVSMKVYDLKDLDTIECEPDSSDGEDQQRRCTADDYHSPAVAWKDPHRPLSAVEEADLTSDEEACDGPVNARGKRDSFQRFSASGSLRSAIMKRSSPNCTRRVVQHSGDSAEACINMGATGKGNRPDDTGSDSSDDEVDGLLRTDTYVTCSNKVVQPEKVQPANLLEVLVQSRSPRAKELLLETPIQELLSLKWMQYGYLGFSIVIAVHLLYVVILSLVVFYRPVKHSDCNLTAVTTETGGGSGTVMCPLVRRSVLAGEAYKSTGDFVRLSGEAFIMLTTVMLLWIEIVDVLRSNVVYIWLRYEVLYSTMKWTYSLLIFVAVILRVMDNDYETPVLSVVVILAWMYVLIFGRAFRLMGPYLIMIRHMLFHDMLRFLVLYAVTVLAFGLGFFVLLQESVPSQPNDFSNYFFSMVTLFRTTLGLSDVELSTFEQSRSTVLGIIYIIFFLIFTYLLLVNFLIAMMERTQNTIAKRQLYIWKGQVAATILYIERRLRRIFPARRFRVGRSGAKLDLDRSRRYLCLEFKEAKMQAFTFNSKNLNLKRQETVLSNLGAMSADGPWQPVDRRISTGQNSSSAAISAIKQQQQQEQQ
eukprot:scpid29404/ scgid11707/ Transient receptor potential cation channel subfamily V member 6; Calcium transport protein 1; Epithelial calcium channel 2